MMKTDPYVLSNEKIKNPPLDISGRLKHLGPSMILSAAIVGSGELIATTTLGAKAGFVCFWIILLSCIVKVMIQLEFGRQTIVSGYTSMQLFGKIPGIKLGKAKWSVWLVLLVMVIKLFQVGGIVGGVAITLHMLFPQVMIEIFAIIVAISAALLVFKGYYSLLEKASLVMIAFFTLFTFLSLYFLKFTPYQISWNDLRIGLSFSLPPDALIYAFGAFGITGVGADEIIHYNYWCLEKGYASNVGPNDGSEAWKQRSQGWIKVMQLDVALALIIYTSVTAAFYLLGAAVLHKTGSLPEGYAMIEVLSEMFTQSLGPWSKTFFIVGALVILFSTVFAALGAWTRQFVDIFGQLRLIDFSDFSQRKKLTSILAWILPLIWAVLFLFIKLPMIMVMSGGVAGSVLLVLVLWVVIYHKYFIKTDLNASSLIYQLFLWISIISILVFSVYGLWQIFSV